MPSAAPMSGCCWGALFEGFVRRLGSVKDRCRPGAGAEASLDEEGRKDMACPRLPAQDGRVVDGLVVVVPRKEVRVDTEDNIPLQYGILCVRGHVDQIFIMQGEAISDDTRCISF
jgi:hypothetical protein